VVVVQRTQGAAGPDLTRGVQGAVGFTTNPVDARMVNNTGSELLLECNRPKEDHVVADAQIKNPTIGQPEVTIDTDSHEFGEGDTWTSNYNFVHVDVERLVDTSNDHKSFVLTFRL